jgi:peptide/nickel transport system substrate-binding protein
MQLLAACGSGSSSTPTNTNRILTIAYPGGWQSLDPSVAFSSENDVLAQIYETLTVYNPTEGGKIDPGLATSWTHNADGTVWTFNLRQGVKFQDGSTFNADAVKFTILRTQRINQGAAYIWNAVKSIDVVSPYVVTLNLSAARPMDLIAAAAWGAFIMSPKSDDQPSTYFQAGKGDGTGPYEWKSYTASQSAVLVKFPGYWGGWKSDQYTTLDYSISADSTTRQEQLLSKTAQLAQYVAYQQLKGLTTNPQVKVHSVNVAGIYYLGFNTTKKPLTDVRVRQALAYSFPHDQVVQTVYGGLAQEETTSLVPQGMWGHTDLPGYTQDLTKAKSLLAAAGYPNGGFTLDEVWIQYYPQDEQIAELWKPVLAQLGITLNITEISSSAWLQDCCSTSGTGPDIMTANWPATYPSPQDYLFSNFGTGGPGGNGSYYRTPQNDALLAQGLVQSATDQTAAAATFAKVQADILDNAATIPVVDFPMAVAADANITNFTCREATLWMYGLKVT